MNDEENGVQSRITEISFEIEKGAEPEDLAKLHAKRAYYLDEIGDRPAAASDYLTSLELGESDSLRCHVMAMLSFLFLKQVDKKEEAMWWAVGARDAFGDSVDGHYAFGLNCEQSGFVSSAIDSYETALSVDPSHRHSKLRLGVCLRELAQITPSVDVLKEYVDRFPNCPEGLYELGWSIHLSLWLQERNQLARDLYVRALGENPSSTLRDKIQRKLDALAGD